MTAAELALWTQTIYRLITVHHGREDGPTGAAEGRDRRGALLIPAIVNVDELATAIVDQLGDIDAIRRMARRFEDGRGLDTAPADARRLALRRAAARGQPSPRDSLEGLKTAPKPHLRAVRAIGGDSGASRGQCPHCHWRKILSSSLTVKRSMKRKAHLFRVSCEAHGPRLKAFGSGRTPEPVNFSL